MSNIKLITDSACDIPNELAQELNIEVKCIPISIEGKGYYERLDFTNQEFYDILLNTPEIPTTARINAADYVKSYEQAAQSGVTELVVVTICAAGSGTNESAHLAKNTFAKKQPELSAGMNIHILDSASYSLGYGHAVIEAARMAKDVRPIEDILAYLRDWLCSVEIYLACFNLDFAKKSGRINSTSAFVGELLGLRPIIHMVNGSNDVREKVRGDKNIVPQVATLTCEAIAEKGEYMVLKGCLDEPADELAAVLTEKLGYPPVGIYNIGASIAINAGPKIVAAIFRGKKRG